MARGKSGLVEKVQTYIVRHKLLSRGDTVVVGVSGGADSTALISILHRLRYTLGVSLIIAHYNYNLRQESKADQRFVESLAQQYHTPCFVKSWPCTGRTFKGSLEEVARHDRFDFFLSLARRHKANAVALAHTCNDQAETVLMRLLRGSGLQGLRGILPQRTMRGVSFIRPLLEITRREIEAYLMDNKMAFRTDRTNQETIFFRNKIRLDLIPFLKRHYNPNIEQALTSLADTVREDYDYLEHQARCLFQQIVRYSSRDQMVRIRWEDFIAAHPALQRMILRQASECLKGEGGNLTLRHVKECENLIKYRPVNSVVDLPDGLRAKKIAKCLVLFK